MGEEHSSSESLRCSPLSCPKLQPKRPDPGKQNQVFFLLFCLVPKRQQVITALCSPKSSEGSKSKSVELQGQCNGFDCCVQHSIGNNWNVSGNSLKGWHVGSFQCVQDTCREQKQRGERQELVQMQMAYFFWLLSLAR